MKGLWIFLLTRQDLPEIGSDNASREKSTRSKNAQMRGHRIFLGTGEGRETLKAAVEQIHFFLLTQLRTEAPAPRRGFDFMPPNKRRQVQSIFKYIAYEPI